MSEPTMDEIDTWLSGLSDRMEEDLAAKRSREIRRKKRRDSTKRRARR